MQILDPNRSHQLQPLCSQLLHGLHRWLSAVQKDASARRKGRLLGQKVNKILSVQKQVQLSKLMIHKYIYALIIPKLTQAYILLIRSQPHATSRRESRVALGPKSRRKVILETALFEFIFCRRAQNLLHCPKQTAART